MFTRIVLITLFSLMFVFSACSGSETSSPISGVQEVDGLVETRVAATVEAMGTKGEPFESAEGLESDLVNAPQIEVAPVIEVSPAIESPGETNDGIVSFDFGGEDSTTEPVPTAAAPATATPGPDTITPVGGTVFFPSFDLAVTLQDTQLVEKVITKYRDVQQETPAREGYRFITLSLQFHNASSEVIDADRVERLIYAMNKTIGDRDNDLFSCSHTEAFDTEYYYLPGYGLALTLYCEIPVTAAADELEGLVFQLDDSIGLKHRFDLGDHSGVPADLSYLEDAIPKYSLPVAICSEESVKPYVIDSAVWYDAPGASPDEELVQRFMEIFDQGNRSIPGNRLPDDPEEAVTAFTTYWNEYWAPVDFNSLDLVAIGFTRANLSKGDIGWGAIELALISENKLESAIPISSRLEQSYLVDPLNFLNSSQLPPGTEQHSTFYIVVPDTDDKVSLLHRLLCSRERKWITIEIPRTEYAQPGSHLENTTVVGGDEESEESSIPIHISVNAKLPHTVTALELEKGQQLRFEYAGGQWRPGPEPHWPLVGPAGDLRVTGKDTFPKPNSPLMALIYGIEGFDQIYQFEGQAVEFTAPASGLVWFAPNDDELDDNAGEILINAFLE